MNSHWHPSAYHDSHKPFKRWYSACHSECGQGITHADVAVGDFQSVGAPVLSGYGVPIELFAPFTDSCVIVMKRLISDVAKDVSRPRTEWNSSLSLV